MGSAGHLYVLSINGAICLQIIKHFALALLFIHYRVKINFDLHRVLFCRQTYYTISICHVEISSTVLEAYCCQEFFYEWVKG
jgi:hypothetical protein